MKYNLPPHGVCVPFHAFVLLIVDFLSKIEKKFYSYDSWQYVWKDFFPLTSICLGSLMIFIPKNELMN